MPEEIFKTLEKPKESNLAQMLREWRAAYPVGALMKTLKNVVDPLKDATLPAKSLVTIKQCFVDPAHARSGPTWILCEDSEKQEWNVPRSYLVKNTFNIGKKGRFRILAQDVEIEKLSHEKS
jgi:hypothetical protein